MPLSTVVAAIDGTRASYEAARQAGRLVQPGGTVRLVAAADPYFAAMNTWAGHRLVTAEEVAAGGGEHLALDVLRERAAESLETARRQVPAGVTVITDVVEGATHDVLMTAARGASVLALGSHGGGRIAGLALASTASDMLRHAPCSVLIARPPFDPDRFPSCIAVAIDGSAPSLAALEVARRMVDGSRGRTTAIGVTAGRIPSDVDTRGIADDIPVEAVRGRVVDALVSVGDRVDLLIMGARGLQRARALGSVSERVAHRAASSVLVVRWSPSASG